jgi:hypothetical protein
MIFYILFAISTVHPDEDFSEDDIDEMLEFKSTLDNDCSVTEIYEMELIPDDLQEILSSSSLGLIEPTKNAKVLKFKEKSLNIFEIFYNKKLDTLNKQDLVLKKPSYNKSRTLKKSFNFKNLKLDALSDENAELLAEEKNFIMEELDHITKLRIEMGLHNFDIYDYEIFKNKKVYNYKKKLKLKNRYTTKNHDADFFK